MSIVRIEEEIQPLKYLVITQEKDPESIVTTNIVISDNRVNKINLISIEKGPQGDTGPSGPIGLPGKDGLIFDVLPVASGGTNNTTFTSGNIIYYDGNKLSSSNYTFQDILDSAGSNSNNITGIITGSGLNKEVLGNTVTLGINTGEGLFVNEANQIAIDDTIVRRVELDLGAIDGVVPISKGGTNNQSFTGNRLLYFDGIKISSFPLNTGNIVLSGTRINVIAGSGLTGGGNVVLPSGSVVLNIGGSEDILVENKSISLSATGIPGTYSKITTDAKGRVIEGSNLTASDILSILGYTPWHPGNDGAGSGLDADLLDGFNSSDFFNLSNHTGTIDNTNLPIQVTPGTYTKVQVNDRGVVVNGQDNTYFDIINALGYRPVSTTGDIINGNISINGDVNLNSDQLTVKDNLPTFGTNSSSILPSEPRGFSFIYGGYTQRTGILAYYPAEKELRLVTNITSDTGNINGGNAENSFTDDIDGGDQNSIFLMGSLSGDPNIVLFKGVADNLYVSRTVSQTISGSKRFADGISVNNEISIIPGLGQTSPPLYVGSNDNMVVNLNSDLLHGEPGSYYTNASNMTGLFDYAKVEFNNIEGNLGYIPVFDNRTQDPSRTISNSYVRQTGNVIQITSDANLLVGPGNTGFISSNRSISAGIGNKIYSDNSLAIGNNNIVSGNNSVALNVGSKALKPTSIAAGNNGYTWANNQLSFGAFIDADSNQTLAQGQYSTIALYLNGAQTDGGWANMSPAVTVPKNKTIAYNLEVLLNKAAGTGAALIAFSSGIIKNSTFRDPENITSIKNITSILKDSTKKEIYNDSQERIHYYHYQLDNENHIQNIEVTRTPLRTPSVVPQNTESLYKYTPEYLSLSGVYKKTNDGNLLLELFKPRSSGWFIQDSGSQLIRILSYDHGMMPGCMANLVFKSGYTSLPQTNTYEVVSVINNSSFTVRQKTWGCVLDNNEMILDPQDINLIDSKNKIQFYGQIYTGSSTFINTSFNPQGILHTGMLIKYGPSIDIYPSYLAQTGIITSITSNSITFNPPFTGTYNGSTIYSYGFCEFEDYTKHILDTCSTLYVQISGYGQQPISNLSGSYIKTYCNTPTLAVKISGLTQNFSGVPALLSNASYNSGLLELIPKRNYTGTYTRSPTQYKIYQGIYTQYPSIDGTSKISVYNKELEPIILPSTPFSYSLACGYGDTDNNFFSISGEYLISRYPFNFEHKSKLSVRLKTSDMSGRSLEKFFDINVLDINDNPYLLNHIPDQYLVVDEPWIFTIPVNTFNDEDFVDSKTYSITLSDDSSLPSWLGFDPAQNTISGVPTILNTGVLSLKISVSDTGNLIAYDVFTLHIDEPETSAQSINLYGSTYSFDIKNLLLNNTNIVENLPSGTILGKLNTIGGYSPYMMFDSAFNNFTGVFVNGSNLVSECTSNIRSYPTTTISGTPDTMTSGLFISSSLSGLPGANITEIYGPLTVNGLVSSGYSVSGCDNSSLSGLGIGLRLLSSLSGWNNQSRIIDINEDSLVFDLPFTGTQEPGTPISLYTVGKILKLDTYFNGLSNTGLVIYSGIKPNTSHYIPSGLQTFSTSFIAGTCPSSYIKNNNIKGFLTQSDAYVTSTGHYMTGVVYFVTEEGHSDISINLSDKLYAEENEDSLYVDFVTASNSMMPHDYNYPIFSGYTNDSFVVGQNFLLPESGVLSSGIANINLDRNHGYQILHTNILNQVPVKFINTQINNSNRLPKNNMFNILNINGNKITIKDSQNYLLKEINNPEYFEEPISASYTTNGFSFSCTFVSGSKQLLNCSNEVISSLQTNSYLGSNANGWPVASRATNIQAYTYFSGSIASGSNILNISGLSSNFTLHPHMLLYSSNSLWPSNGINILGVSSSNIILSSAPSMEDWNNFNFYTKPTVTLDNPTCLSNGLSVTNNNRVFFNGDIISISGFSVPRSYLNNGDQFEILSWNNNSALSSSRISKNLQVTSQNSRRTSLSGRAVNSSGNTLYPLGRNINTELPPNGSLSFIGSVSGYCSIPFNNNIYYHSNGGITSVWPTDPSGISVLPPQTGIYVLGTSSQTCSSGTLCVTIKGYKDTSFGNIADIVDRSTIGKQPNLAETISSSGYVRPWGLNKKFFFDFSDDAPELNGIYYVVDKIDNTTFTINVPYNLNYLGRSGLVYIIDSDYNIKSNRNPNINNELTISYGNISISGSTNLVDYYINSYNDQTHRWKHLIHFNNTINNFSGYDSSIHGQQYSQLISLSPELINISKVEYSFDNGLNYNLINNNETIQIPSIKSQLNFRITTENGAGKWSSDLKKSAPKININGIGSYNIDSDNILYNTNNKNWTIPISVFDLTKQVINYPITIKASDEGGSHSVNLYLNTYPIPVIEYPGTGYVYQNDSLNWILPFDIKDLPQNSQTYIISLSGHPGNSFNVSNEGLIGASGTKVFTGTAGAITGIFNPVLTIKDYATQEVLASQSGTIIVLATNDPKPTYSINPQGLKDQIYLNMTNTESASFSFFLPAINNSNSNIDINFEPNPSFGINPIIEYSTVSERYRVTAVVTGIPGYYPGQNINIAISQPVVDSEDNVTWVRYNYTRAYDITLYRQIEINKTELTEPLVFDKQQPWAAQFKIDNGICSHNPNISPKIKLSNLPNIGNYEDQPLEYKIATSYDNSTKRWIVSINGKANVFGRYTDSIGPHPVSLYVEDGFSSVTGYINLFFTESPYIDNVRPKIYSTPNNGYKSNIDIKQTNDGPDLPPLVVLPAVLKENTINVTRSSYKYDKDFDIWEYSYSGSPIYDKWDVALSVTNTNTVLANDQNSSMIVSCRGISTDKIYGVGKLDLVELDSNIVAGLPFQIIDVSFPYYSLQEGSPWRITFSTIGGLENPNYPPTILLSGLPSSCSGYSPKLSLEQQASCFSSRQWNPASKKWSFEFIGLPLCNIQGLKPFTIFAIDTDTTQNLYLGSDRVDASLNYRSLEDNGLVHPKPQIIPAPGQEAQDPILLYPLCNTPVDKYYKFGIRNRDICPAPTGITGWAISGSLPSGVNYSITFPGGNPSPPWSNLGSGTLRIYGDPQIFAGGSIYNEKLYLTVFDARNQFITKEFKFLDAASANPPSPISLAVYFDSIKPSYTQRRTVTEQNTSLQPSGTFPVDRYGYTTINTYWPAPHPSSLICTSILPHSQCQTSNFVYSGANYLEGDFNLYLSDTRFALQNGNSIYVEFDNDSDHEYNGTYSVQATNNLRYINIPGHSFSTGIGRLVKYDYKPFTTQELQKFNGTIDINTSSSIMGCGTFKLKNYQGDFGHGLFGRMRPSFIASIPTSGAFRSDDSLFSGLNISILPEYDYDKKVYTVKTSNCWETGYVRISGICVPRPSIELTNPPPAYDFAPFSYNNQAYSVLARCTYGNSQYERDRAENYRQVSVNYSIKNVVPNTILSNGSVTSIAGGSSQGQPIQFNHILNSGAVFSVFLNNNPSIFPTYIYNAIPYVENEYFWIHKGGNRDDNPTQSSFPPVIMTGIKNSISCISGVSISGYVVKAVGGYIPYSGGSQRIPFYSLDDNSLWSLIDYTPSFTGVVQQPDKYFDGTYSHSGLAGGANGQILNITLPNGFSPGDSIELSLSGPIVLNTGLFLNENYNNNIQIPLDRTSLPQVSGPVRAYSKCVLDSIDGSTVTIRHNNIPYITGNYLDIVRDRLLSTDVNIMPYNYRLSIVSGDSRYLVANFDGPSSYDFTNGLNVSGFYHLRQNYYDQINIANVIYVKEGEWRFNLSGTPSGLYKDYMYKMISIENSSLPAFSGTSLTPKKYVTEYPLYINKPIEIILPESVIESGITNSNGAWSLSFEIEGGSRPVYDHTPEILINDSICSFSRQLSPQNMNDSYNANTDRLSITLSSSNSTNFDWKNIQTMNIKAYDDTGVDTATVYLNQPEGLS